MSADDPNPTAPRWKSRIPNALTIARLILAGVFVGVIAVIPNGGAQDHPTHLVIATVVFLVAAITDALDGYLARAWNVVSLFGRVMDPFADKLLVLGGFVMLCGPAFAVLGPVPTDTGTAQPTGPGTASLGPSAAQAGADAGATLSAIEPWMVVVILARELLVTSIRGAYEARGVDFSATTSGKAKMVLQSIAVPAILLLVAFTDTSTPGSIGRAGVLGLAWVTTLVTAWSGVPYVAKAFRASRDTDSFPKTS